MVVKTFRNVSCFQVFVPEERGWLKFRSSWNEPGIWHCEFYLQNGDLKKRMLLSSAYAEDVWHRFKSQETCETTFLS